MSVALESGVEALAREAAVDVAEDANAVGATLDAFTDDDGFTTVKFAANVVGYQGWSWTVVLAHLDGESSVCEAYLLPETSALLAPEWVPWSERVQPGDLDAAMVLPFIAEDPRLTPGYTAVDIDDFEADAMDIFEFGLGRERVLAPEGRDAVADRWERGSHGPHAPSAIAATAQCATCAFFIPLTGSMRMAFGACANEWSPSDGRVVTVDHGCGAHSQTDAERRLSEWPVADPIIDSEAVVAFDLQAPDPEPEPEPVVEASAVDTEAVDTEAVDTEAVAEAVVEAEAMREDHPTDPGQHLDAAAESDAPQADPAD